MRESKAVKSLHFPNRKRIKGKRGGRKEDLAEARSTELQDWLNNAIKICESDARSLTLIQRIEDWFLTSNHHLEDDDADGFRDSYGASPPADPTPPPSTGGDAEARRREEADMLAAIQMSLGQPVQGQQPQPPGGVDPSGPAAIAGFNPTVRLRLSVLCATPLRLGCAARLTTDGQRLLPFAQPTSERAQEGVPPELASLGASARATTQPPVDRLKTTLDAIEMGFPPVSESSSASVDVSHCQCGRRTRSSGCRRSSKRRRARRTTTCSS